MKRDGTRVKEKKIMENSRTDKTEVVSGTRTPTTVRSSKTRKTTFYNNDVGIIVPCRHDGDLLDFSSDDRAPIGSKHTPRGH